MIKKQRIVVILPAYNAEKTLQKTIEKIPKEFYDEIILVDDASKDKTFKKARSLGIKAFRNKTNLGYGGNLKVCLIKALESGADIIAEIHPDNEYDASSLPNAIEKIQKGALLVLGNRFTSPFSALKMGMPFWKYVPSKILSTFNKYIFKIDISDWHQGFRVYSKNLLENINFLSNSNNYLFSFEIINQAIFFKMKIDEVSVVCEYKGKKRGASFKYSLFYTLGTLRVIIIYLLTKLSFKNKIFFKIKKDLRCGLCGNKGYVMEKYKSQDFITKETFSIYYCNLCKNAFTFPLPKNLAKYYPPRYFGKGNFSSLVRENIYPFFQKRRTKELYSLSKNGSILDVGAGEGHIGKILKKKGFSYQGIEAKFANLNNKEILKIDFLQFNPQKKYNIITFWQSFEHFPSPDLYLKHAKKLLRENGYLIIEIPCFDSLESTIFGGKWYHLSVPRHISHFTGMGVSSLLEKEGFRILKQKEYFAFEYSIFGFIQSVLNLFQSQDKIPLTLIKKNIRPLEIFFNFILISMLTPISFLAQVIFYFLKTSPVFLFVAVKKE